MSRLAHPNLVPILDFNIDDDPPYFLMPQYLQSLASMRDTQSLPDDPRRVLLPIIDAVRYMHSCGFAHRDLHPGNVLSDGTSFAVGDFSLAKDVRFASRHTFGRLGGLQGYAAPEQLRLGGHGDLRSDIFSLGSLIFLATTKNDPQGSSNQLTLVPAEYRPTIERCWRQLPSERFQSVEEVKQRLITIWDNQRRWESVEWARDLDSVLLDGDEELVDELISAAYLDWHASLRKLGQIDDHRLKRLTTQTAFASLLNQLFQGAKKHPPVYESLKLLGALLRKVASSSEDPSLVLMCLEALLSIGNQHDVGTYRKVINQLIGSPVKRLGLEPAVTSYLEEHFESRIWLESRPRFRKAS